MMTRMMRQMVIAASAAAALSLTPVPSLAQGLFSPVIKVDDQVITRFEIEQRAAFVKVLNTPGDLVEFARNQLIEDRLKMAAARAAGITVTQEQLQQGLTEFASRGNLKPEQFLQLLAQEGIDKQSVMDFLTVGLSWRQLVQARFGRKVSVSEVDIDRAMDALGGGNSVRVLLSEVVIPLQQGYEEQIKVVAERVALIDDFASFAEAAKQYSASRSREQGGRLGWLPITQLPAPLRPVLLGLAPGETTSVIPMQGALAVFQMRAIAESDYRAPEYAAVEYAALYLPGGRSAETLAEAEELRGRVDTCDDLYGVNFGQPDERLERTSLTPQELPRDYALELAKLDKGELSYNLTRNDGQELVVLMLCGRTPAVGEDTSREDVSRQLRNQQLESFANGYLEELRSEARIQQ